MRADLTAAVTLEQPQYQASELMISAALNGFRLAEVPTTVRDRASHRACSTTRAWRWPAGSACTWPRSG